MDVVPAPTPVTTPVDETMVATELVPLVQVPPGLASVRVIALPWHTLASPVIVGNKYTLMVAVALHPAAVV